jgi:phosphoserine phosphatase RsbU/P
VPDTRKEWNDTIARLVLTSHLVQPSGLAAAVGDVLRPIGAEAIIYLADREQEMLRALPQPGLATTDPIDIDATMAGRSFRRMSIVVSPEQSTHAWLPILDGTERLGVLAITLPARMSGHDPAVQQSLRALCVLIGHLLVAKISYGDSVRQTRRSRPMSVGGELLWRMLPPLTFATHNLILSAIMEPCYNVGGDAYDYAIDNDRARITIFDAVGHDLNAAITSTIALAATRSARILGADLSSVASAADQALTAQFTDLRYVTAVLAELDLRTGHMQLLNAGHPPPVLLRAGRSVAVLDGGRRLPLGLDEGDGNATVSQVALEPGDILLLYTDGITEARDDTGELLGVNRLVQLAEREMAAGYPTPETVRRLSRAILQGQHDDLHDDATLMLVQWGPREGIAAMP